MKNLLNLLASLLLTLHIISCEAHTPATSDIIINDFKEHMSASWGAYKLTEFYSGEKESFKYLEKTFSKSVLKDAILIETRYLNIAELNDTEGGFDFGLLKLNYPDLETSRNNFKTIITSKNKNLRGNKVFMGYTAIRCDKSVFIISSPAVASREIKNYFLHIKTAEHLCVEK